MEKTKKGKEDEEFSNAFSTMAFISPINPYCLLLPLYTSISRQKPCPFAEKHYGKHKFPEADSPAGMGNLRLIFSPLLYFVSSYCSLRCKCKMELVLFSYYPPIIRFPTSPLFPCEHIKSMLKRGDFPGKCIYFPPQHEHRQLLSHSLAVISETP